MKKLFSLIIVLSATTFAFAQEWHVGANITNTMMIYETPFPEAGDPVTTSTVYHYGALVNVEKGLDLYNQWRLGVEVGFTGSTPLETSTSTILTTPGLPAVSTELSKTSFSWIPIRALVSYNSYKIRRKVNFRTSLAIGYAIGSSATDITQTTIVPGVAPVVLTIPTVNNSWGGLTFAYRLGAQFTLKKDAIFLNAELGYHGIVSDYNGMYPSYNEDGEPSIDPILVNGAELNIGVVFRLWKYHQ